MRIKQQADILYRARGEAKSLCMRAMREGQSQQTYLDAREAFFSNLHPGLPKSRVAELRSYINGVMDAVEDTQTVHMYRVDGKLYATHHEADRLGLPCWDTLPRDQYGNLASMSGNEGGIFWFRPGIDSKGDNNLPVYFQSTR